MAIRTNGAVLRQLRTLFDQGAIGELTDGQLLERFTTMAGESAELAFAALVERHGSMVLRVCRNSLADPNDAQDAFQATFLVLVRKAQALWVQDSLGPWLHRVAHRMAGRARASATRRREHERRAAEARPVRLFVEDDRNDVYRILNEEIDRLPEPCRVPVVLCDLEGTTHEQAARRLGWPLGTVKSRLMRGRERLKTRLIRRGIAPSVILPAGASFMPSSPSAVPAVLVDITVRNAALIADGLNTAGVVPATVAFLLEGAMSTMFVHKMKLAVLACGLIATGTLVVAQQEARKSEAAVRPLTAKAGASRIPKAISDTQTSKSPIDTDRDVGAFETDLDGHLAEIEANLLEEEVEALSGELTQSRDRVGVAFTNRFHSMAKANLNPSNPHDEVDEDQKEYEEVRASYVARARELVTARHRLEELGRMRGKPASQVKAGLTPPSEARKGEKKSALSAPNPPASAIGSINMDVVLKRSVKFQRESRRLSGDLNHERERLKNLEGEVKELFEQMRRRDARTPASDADEQKIANLKSQIEAGREIAQREFTRREAQMMAGLLQEIQQTIAALAKSRGINYVVKVSAEPTSDSDPNDVMTSWGRSVLYADPRNDLTEEVISELNRKFAAAGASSSK